MRLKLERYLQIVRSAGSESISYMYTYYAFVSTVTVVVILNTFSRDHVISPIKFMATDHQSLIL